MNPKNLLTAFALLAAVQLAAQEADSIISVRAPLLALTHAKLIDGTGAAPRDDQTIIVRDGRIAAVGPGAEVAIPRARAPSISPARPCCPAS